MLSVGSVSTPSRTHFEFLTLDDLERLPDPEWLIGGLVPKNSFAALYGPPGSGKTFLALDWALSVACGQPWFEQEIEQGDVVYVCAEGVNGLKKRTRAWQLERNVAPGDAFRMICKPINVREDDKIDHLVRDIGHLKLSPKLIVLDTLARCFGDGDENQTVDMNKFVANVGYVVDAFGCTVLVIHHTGKNEKRGERGNSALRGAADTLMALKDGQGLTLTCEKQKEWEPFKDVPLKLRNAGESLVIDRDQPFLRYSGSAPMAKPRTDDRALDILAAAEPDGLSYSGWEAKCIEAGVKESTFKTARKRLFSTGRVCQSEDRYHVSQ